MIVEIEYICGLASLAMRTFMLLVWGMNDFTNYEHCQDLTVFDSTYKSEIDLLCVQSPAWYLLFKEYYAFCKKRLEDNNDTTLGEDSWIRQFTKEFSFENGSNHPYTCYLQAYLIWERMEQLNFS